MTAFQSLLRCIHPSRAESGSFYCPLMDIFPRGWPLSGPLSPDSLDSFPTGCWAFSPTTQAFLVPCQSAVFLGTFWIHIPIIPDTVNATLNTNLLVVFARTFFFFAIHTVSITGLVSVPILASTNIIIMYSNLGECLFCLMYFVKHEIVSCTWIFSSLNSSLGG